MRNAKERLGEGRVQNRSIAFGQMIDSCLIPVPAEI